MFNTIKISKNSKAITWEISDRGCWIPTSHKFIFRGKEDYPTMKINSKTTKICKDMKELLQKENTVKDLN